MQTKTFYWPGKIGATTEIEVFEDGTIHRAYSWCPDTYCMGDVTERVKTLPVWNRRAQEFAQAQDWSRPDEQEAERVDDIRATVAKIIGVKPA